MEKFDKKLFYIGFDSDLSDVIGRTLKRVVQNVSSVHVENAEKAILKGCTADIVMIEPTSCYHKGALVANKIRSANPGITLIAEKSIEKADRGIVVDFAIDNPMCLKEIYEAVFAACRR